MVVTPNAPSRVFPGDLKVKRYTLCKKGACLEERGKTSTQTFAPEYESTYCLSHFGSRSKDPTGSEISGMNDFRPASLGLASCDRLPKLKDGIDKIMLV
jgi:hypothetical protein